MTCTLHKIWYLAALVSLIPRSRTTCPLKRPSQLRFRPVRVNHKSSQSDSDRSISPPFRGWQGLCTGDESIQSHGKHLSSAAVTTPRAADRSASFGQPESIRNWLSSRSARRTIRCRPGRVRADGLGCMRHRPVADTVRRTELAGAPQHTTDRPIAVS